MNARTPKNSPKISFFVRMVLLVWGLVWFGMSVFIFILGRVMPPLRSKPPPLIAKPRSPRIPSLCSSPVPPSPKTLPADQDDIVPASQSITSNQQTTASESSSSRRPSFRSRWSFSGRFSASPRSSLSSQRSLPHGPSPTPRYLPELSAIESVSQSSDPKHDQDVTSTSIPPLDSARPSRNARLPNMKMFKTLSRKMFTKQEDSEHMPSPRSFTVPALPLVSPHDESDYDLDKKMSRAQTTEECGTSKQAHQSHLRLHRRNSSIPGEVFTTTFVNPFRIKARKPKAPLALTDQLTQLPPVARISRPRRMLNSLQLTLTSNGPHAVAAVPDSPRSSVSSVSTSISTFSNPSTFSSLSSSSGSPRSVRRTQPYGAPYYAALPGPGPGLGPSAWGGRSSSATPRRAMSLSAERRPDTVAEESGECEDALNALGLEFGRVEQQPREVQTEPRGRMSRHRVMASEGAVVLGMEIK